MSLRLGFCCLGSAKAASGNGHGFELPQTAQIVGEPKESVVIGQMLHAEGQDFDFVFQGPAESALSAFAFVFVGGMLVLADGV